MLCLQALGAAIGALAALCRDHAWGVIAPETMLAAFETASGQELDALWSFWFEQTGATHGISLPRLATLLWRYLSEVRGLPRVDVAHSLVADLGSLQRLVGVIGDGHLRGRRLHDGGVVGLLPHCEVTEVEMEQRILRISRLPLGRPPLFPGILVA